MRKYPFGWVIMLGVLSIVGLVAMQIYWVRKAFALEEQQFDYHVNVALKKVADHLLQYNQHRIPPGNPVYRHSSNYYTVAVNDVIDANILEFYLKNELSARRVQADFEYGIYNCESSRMVYGNYVRLSPGQPPNPVRRSDLPQWKNENYYFGVRFPGKTSHLLSEMDFWTFSSAVMLLVVVFFAFALFTMLRQKRLFDIQKSFINNLAHEFKTPLSTIAISSEVIQTNAMHDNPPRTLNYAAIIWQETKHLTSQVERVLQMATAERNGNAMHLEVIDLHELIGHSTKQSEVLLKKRQGCLTTCFEAENAHIRADRLHLMNVFYNLLDNAVKYCQNNPVLQLRTYNERQGIIIEIQDNGIGIRPEHQKRVFEKFYRVPTGNLHNVKGFGLGLSYVKSIVKMHRGSVTLQNSTQQGSCFRLFFPTVQYV